MNGDGGDIYFCRKLLKYKLIGSIHVVTAWGVGDRTDEYKIVGKASAGDVGAFALWFLGTHHNCSAIFRMDLREAVMLEP